MARGTMRALINIDALTRGTILWHRTTGVFCKKCYYDLRACSEACPECGQCFDIEDDQTFVKDAWHFHWHRLRRAILILGAIFGVLAIPLGLFLYDWHLNDLGRGFWSAQPNKSGSIAYQPEYAWAFRHLPVRMRALSLRADSLRLSGTGWTDAESQNIGRLRYLTWLELRRTSISANGLIQLQSLKRLKNLNLIGPTIDDSGLKALLSLRELDHLSLVDTGVQGAGLDYVPMDKLIRLDICGHSFNDSGMRHIARFTGLEVLLLCGSGIDDDGLAPLGGLVNVRDLDLSETKIKGRGLKYLAGMVHLRHLNLADSPITDQCIELLVNLPQLETLNISGTSISSGRIERLRAALPKTQIGFDRSDAVLEVHSVIRERG